MISAGLDQSDDEALYEEADISRQKVVLYETHESLWRRIFHFFGKLCLL